MNSEKKRPLVGLGVIVRKGNALLYGLHIAKNGLREWSFPGGHLEFGETPETGSIREVEEETGLIVHSPKFVCLTNDVFRDPERVEAEQKHYVTLFYVVQYQSGSPIPEQGVFERWEWFGWGKHPLPLRIGTKQFINLGLNPFE